ncbi:MAG: hypothetical protein ACYDCC_07185 [Actinomycetota bacterium]
MKRLALVGPVAMLGAITLGVAPASAIPQAPNCSVFPSDNIWHADVSTLPVNAHSAQWIASSGGASQHLHPDFGPSDTSTPYGIPYNIVSGSHPKVSVDFQYADESDNVQYPLGSDTVIENGSDAHALMLDKDHCVLYEIYDTTQDSSGWHGGSGAMFNLTSNQLRPAGWTSADAAGLPIFAGLIRRDEITSGVIDHAIRMTVSQTDTSYLWPARHQAGSASDPTLPPMGAWFRLKQSFDISSFSPEAQVVLRAMKVHGMIVADNGSNWYFGGAAEDGWSNSVLDELKSITAGSFEAVDVSSLMVNPDSGQIRTGPQARVSVSINASHLSVHAGATVTFSGRVVPTNPGSRASLQMLNGQTHRWFGVSNVMLDPSSRYVATYRRRSRGYLLFRIFFPSQNGYLWNVSRALRINWT